MIRLKRVLEFIAWFSDAKTISDNTWVGAIAAAEIGLIRLRKPLAAGLLGLCAILGAGIYTLTRSEPALGRWPEPKQGRTELGSVPPTACKIDVASNTSPTNADGADVGNETYSRNDLAVMCSQQARVMSSFVAAELSGKTEQLIDSGVELGFELKRKVGADAGHSCSLSARQERDGSTIREPQVTLICDNENRSRPIRPSSMRWEDNVGPKPIKKGDVVKCQTFGYLQRDRVHLVSTYFAWSKTQKRYLGEVHGDWKIPDDVKPISAAFSIMVPADSKFAWLARSDGVTTEFEDR